MHPNPIEFPKLCDNCKWPKGGYKDPQKIMQSYECGSILWNWNVDGRAVVCFHKSDKCKELANEEDIFI